MTSFSRVVVPRWFAGERELIRADVQRFLDRVQSAHPEVDRMESLNKGKVIQQCTHDLA